MAEHTPGWRKSSYSVDNGHANCVEVGSAPWRKSSYSIDNGNLNCVEAATLPGAILVRDTTQHGHGPVLRLTATDWTRLTQSVKH
jgi:hypothetical protein